MKEVWLVLRFYDHRPDYDTVTDTSIVCAYPSEDVAKLHAGTADEIAGRYNRKNTKELLEELRQYDPEAPRLTEDRDERFFQDTLSYGVEKCLFYLHPDQMLGAD